MRLFELEGCVIKNDFQQAKEAAAAILAFNSTS